MNNFYNLEYCLNQSGGYSSVENNMLIHSIIDKNIDHQKLIVSTLSSSFLLDEKEFNKQCIITTVVINNKLLDLLEIQKKTTDANKQLLTQEQINLETARGGNILIGQDLFNKDQTRSIPLTNNVHLVYDDVTLEQILKLPKKELDHKILTGFLACQKNIRSIRAMISKIQESQGASADNLSKKMLERQQSWVGGCSFASSINPSIHDNNNTKLEVPKVTSKSNIIKKVEPVVVQKMTIPTIEEITYSNAVGQKPILLTKENFESYDEDDLALILPMTLTELDQIKDNVKKLIKISALHVLQNSLKAEIKNFEGNQNLIGSESNDFLESYRKNQIEPKLGGSIELNILKTTITALKEQTAINTKKINKFEEIFRKNFP